MSDERPLRIAGWVVPPLGRLVWITVAASAGAYFVFGRPIANLIAIVGGILITVVLVKRDRQQQRRQRREDVTPVEPAASDSSGSLENRAGCLWWMGMLSVTVAVSLVGILAVTVAASLDCGGVAEASPSNGGDGALAAVSPRPVVSWQALDTGVAPRSNYSLSVAGDQAYVWGGVGEDGVPADGLVLGPGGEIVGRIGEAPIEGRRRHTSVWTGEELVVWGGADHFGFNRFDDGAAYDPMADSWRVIAASPLGSSTGHTAVWTGEEMIIWGGTPGSNIRSGLGAAYDPGSDSWRILRSAPISARSDHSAVWTGSEMVVWGGVTDEWLNDGAAYNPTRNTWRKLCIAPLDPVQTPAMFWSGSHVVLMGGANNTGQLPPGALWDPTTDDWVALPDVLQGNPRTAAQVSDLIVVVAGADANVFDLRTNTWSELEHPVMEAVGGYQLAVLDGQLILFGGFSGNDDEGPYVSEVVIGTVELDASRRDGG